MLDFTVQRFTRRCHQTERDLQPGETVYSVLIPQEAQVIRRDYSLEAWTGPPEDAIGWWRSKVEEGKDANAPPKVEQAPDEALWSYLHSLSDQPENEDVRYILALLLVRRRLARLENTENDEFGREILVRHPTLAQRSLNCSYPRENLKKKTIKTTYM